MSDCKFAFKSLGLALCVLATAGCNPSLNWDREYACSGQERSSTLQDIPASSERFEKIYPIEIDFHLRSDFALVKSYQVKQDTTPGNPLTFSSRSPALWVSGSFDIKSGELILTEGRSLVVDGKKQETMISGQYHCQVSGAATV
jgi:hypothetical protein